MQHEAMSVEPPPVRLAHITNNNSPPQVRSPQCSEEEESPSCTGCSEPPSPHTTVSLATTVSVSSDITTTNWWHPHVYSRPPKNPTPHFISDILGLQGNQEQPLNLTITKPKTEKIPPVVLSQPNPVRRPFRQPPIVNGHTEPGITKSATQIKGKIHLYHEFFSNFNY
jgi:hypothetical protein